MPNTPMQGFPYPALSDAANGPVAFQNLAQAIEKRVVQIYADAAARTAAVAAPTAGMFSFLTTTGQFEYYTGTAWVALRPLTNSVFTQTVGGSGNFVKPTGPPARFHWVRLWGAGGAGGGTVGAGTGTSEGGGGGAGAFCERWYADSELAASEPWTVGAGGTGVSGNVGNSGGNTTFKGMTAGGGGGGQAMTSGATDTGANHGNGGTASGGHLNSAGGDGGKGRRIGSTCCFTGRGGGSPSGGGEVAFANFGASAGQPGATPGGGGTGSFSSTVSFAGGAGAAGKILIVSIY